jgi:fengycin family lipopeptide synthetase D
MMPIRVQGKKGWSFFQLLKVQQQHSLESKKYEYLPIVEVQSQSAMKGDLIDHLLSFENFPLQESEESEEGEADFAVVGFEGEGQTNYNFDITIVPGKNYQVIFTYNAQVYDSDVIKSIPGHLENILWQVVENPGVDIDQIEIITEEEKNKLLYEFNDTKAVYPQDKTIHELIEAQTFKTPGNTAVVFNDKQLTYQGLNEKTNQLAKVLREKQVKPDKFVGLMLERSLEMMIGILAILKAGGAYLPIDPDYPPHRIHFMLEDISGQLLLSQETLMGEVDFGIEIIDIGDELLYTGDEHNLPLVNKPGDLAYAIYTSGSTGKPKGVLIQHRSLINMAYSQMLFYPIDETDRVLQFSTISFDASAEQIYIALFSGATLVLLDKTTLLDMNKFERFMDDQQLTHIDSVPLFINTIPLRSLFISHQPFTKMGPLL